MIHVSDDSLHFPLNFHMQMIQSLYDLGFPGSGVRLDSVQNDSTKFPFLFWLNYYILTKLTGHLNEGFNFIFH